MTGHTTTSTGTESLDKLLGLGAGLALGSSLFIEEEGTTEFARSLISCYAAEGILQGHAVFIIGPEGSLALPGLATSESRKGERMSAESDKMKIAWRYERLGAFEERQPALSRGAPTITQSSVGDHQGAEQLFCHTFDLTRRLEIPSSSHPPQYLLPSPTVRVTESPYAPIISTLRDHLQQNPGVPTRLVIPSLLSPLMYPPTASQPHNLLPYLHSLRALLRQYTILTTLTSWPLSLYPSTSPLTRWSRLLNDGVITLRPFPHSFSVDAIDLDLKGQTKGKGEEKMQGLIQVVKLPVLSERGSSVGMGEDMAFSVSRRAFRVRPFHLPPLDAEVPDGGEGEGKEEGKGLDF